MAKYQVEVDRTSTYVVTIDADTVEEALVAAESHKPGDAGVEFLWSFATAKDAVELEQAS